MEFWVDIEDAAGNRLGAGPITSAAEWRSSPRLDEAGEFSFSMPAADPQAALLANRRIARCWAVVDGAVKQISAGIIDTIEVEPGEPTMLRVSGPDLLAELAGRTIPRLTVCEQALQYLTLNMDTGHWRGSVRWISNRYGATFDVDLPAAHDAVVDTGGELITMWSEGDPNIEYLYVGCDARFDYVRIWLGDYLETNRRASSLIGQYYDGNGWADLPDMVDGTMGQNAYSEWCTFNQNGVISFSRPADWARVQPTAQAGSWFWVRFTVQPGQVTDEIRLREAAVWADVPTTGGVNQIMAYAPDTWVRTGYPATTSAKYLEIEGESVLAALRSLSEQGGQDGGGVPVREHFRLGAGRSLAWFSQFSASGVRAVRAPATGAGLLAAESRGEVCFIRSLTERRDTAEVVTRLYPTSNDGVTLHLTTRSAPAGYSLSKVDGYLQNDAGASLHGRIEASVRFTDVSMQQADSWYEHPSMAANALFDRALEYLRTHGVAQRFYDLEIVKAGGGLLPGHTLRVVYHEYADGHHAVDIDADLCVLGVTQAIDADGLHTVGVEASTVDRQAMDDVDVLRNAVQDGRRSGQVVSGMTVITAGQGSGHGGGASFPGTVSLTTINTDTGAEHFHRMDISPHLSNAAAHHAPVTVGNTGLALSTQQVSLNLAAVSGLQISSGLMLDDTIAGDGLSIANKVLGVDLATNSGLLLSGTPAKLAVRTPSGSLGGTSTNAVSDAAGHSHDVATAAPSLVFGTTAAEGSGNDLIRADATLALFDTTVPAQVTASAAAGTGSAGKAARRDHVHSLSTAAPALAFGTTAATGDAGSVVRTNATVALFDTTVPSTLSSSSVAATGSAGKAPRRDHVHGITAYSDMSAYKGHLAKSDADGRGKWVSLTATEYLRTSLLDSEAATALTIAPALDLYLSPGDTKRVRATSAVRLQADNYVSQTTGWAVAYNGAADFRYLYTDELHAKAFMADLEQALAGGQIISKSVAPLSRDFTAPAAGGTADLWVECFEGFPDQQVFQAGDVVMLRSFSRASGSLDITNCFGTVSAPYFPSPQSDPPEQRWTFTRLSGTVNGHPAAGYMAKSAVVKRGALALDFGTTGMGYHEVNAIDGAMGEYSPYAQNVYWTQHPWYDRTVATRDGNLRGIFNEAGEYGLYAGEGTAAASRFVRISNEAIEAHNLPVHLYDGTNVTIALEPGSGTPSIAIGDPLPTGWLTQPGWWAGKDGAAYKQYVGTVSGGDLVRGAMWDGTNYHVRGNLIVGPGTGFVVEDALLHCPFDGTRPYETAFDVDLAGHLGQAPTTATGGIIGRPGKFGKAVQVAGATQNMILNPSFETGTESWRSFADGTGKTFERNALAAWIGSYGLRWVLGSGTTGQAYLKGDTGAPTQGVTYTASVWVKGVGTAIGKRFYLGLGEYGGISGTGVTYSAHVALTGEWQRFSVSRTVEQADRTSLGIIPRYYTGAATGDELYVDAAQVEAKPYATPYCDGSLGAGHSWSGTAHASTSSRTIAALSYANPLPTSGPFSVALWAVSSANLSGVNSMGLWAAGTSTTATRCDAWHRATGPGWYSGRAGSWIQGGTAMLAHVPQHIVCTWDGTYRKLYVDGALVATSADESATPPYIDPTLWVGRYVTGSNFPGWVDDLLLLDRAMSADEVLALYESGKPATVTTSPMSLLLTGAGRGRVQGNASGLFGSSATGAASFALATEPMSWGGGNLDAGDVLIGSVTANNYMQWDASAAALVIKGQITIQAGSSGIASLSDAGALATKNAVDLATGEVLNKSADNIAEGTTRKWAAESGADITGSHTAYDTARVSGTAAATVKDGATRANAGLTVSGNVARLIRGSDLGAGSGAAVGLNMTSANLGYYNGSSWPVFISSQGYFQFQKDASNYFKWDGTTFEFKGRVVVTSGTTVDTLPDGTTYGKVAKTIISGGYIQVGSGTKDSTLDGWNISSAEIVGQLDGADQVVLGTDGKIKAGGGAVTLDATGLSVAGPNGSWDVTRALKVRDYNNDKVVFSVGSINPTSGLYRTYLWATGNSSSYASSEMYIQANVYGDDISDQDARIVLKSTYGGTGPSISIYGVLRAVHGLYVGTSSTPSTTTGEIYASKSIGVGVSYTPGDGNIDAVGYVRGQKGLVIGDGVTAPTAASGVAFIYVDNADGDLKVRFGDGTTKVLAADT